ncbi:MAG TPA: hypothetical protein VJ547_11985 [Candidatus Thermoplasmatota archaeon]|nr:hypothetical protein [Candidatus Thermoplasmatota archaeon]
MINTLLAAGVSDQVVDVLMNQGPLGVLCVVLLGVVWYLERRRMALVREKEDQNQRWFLLALEMKTACHKEMVEVLSQYQEDQRRFDEVVTTVLAAVGPRRR